MESGNAGNPDLNHNTCLAKKNLKTVQASSVIKSLTRTDGSVPDGRIYPKPGIHLVIDATHPHADLFQKKSRKRADGPVSAWNGACAQRANKTKHVIGSRLIPFRRQCHFFCFRRDFATTGSKELEALCQIPDYQNGCMRECFQLRMF